MAKISYSQKLRTLLCAALIGVLFLSLPVSADDAFTPVYKPTMDVGAASGKINVDGRLGDEGWKNARRVTTFVEREPGDQTKPAVKTEAYITYDEDNLYIAFVCHDDPTQIRATMCQRDQFFDDDAVSVSLDTYNDASRAYMFYVNPYGIQKDGLWSSISMFGINYGIDLIWNSSAQVTEKGYQVEIGIPFASIRFPDRDSQTWKVDLRRIRPRESNFTYASSALDRNEQCWPCQWSTITGVKSVKPGKGIEVLPTYVAHQSGQLPSPNDEFDNGDVKGEPSLMGKYAISSDITLEGTMNPDFSQIEADAARIDVNSTFAQFFPERRPFFQEGSDIFMTLFNSYYTRTIWDPQYATKFTVRKNRTTFGFVSALDENSPYLIPLEDGSIDLNAGQSVVNVIRGARSFGQDSRLGFMVTDRRFKKDGFGTTVALDGDLRLSQTYSVDGQFVYSFTGEPNDTALSLSNNSPDEKNFIRSQMHGTNFSKDKYTTQFDGEKYQGYAFISRFMRNSRHLNFVLDHDVVGPAYRTEVGFDPVNNHRTVSFNSSYLIFPKGTIFERITPQFGSFNRWSWDGPKKFQNISVSISGRLRYAQSVILVNFDHGLERYANVEFRDMSGIDLNFNTRPSDQFGFFMGLHYGDRISYSHVAVGNQFGADLSLALKPISRITIEPDFNYVSSKNPETDGEFFRQMIMRTRLQLQVNRELSLRVVLQYNDFRIPDYHVSSKRWDIDPLITYRLSSFSVFYIGSTNNFNHYDYVDVNSVNQSDWKLRRRQFFMKLQYLFQT